MTESALRVDGDLRFTVQDAGRRASGTVTAAGATVTVDLDRPWVALRAVRSTAMPAGASVGRSDLAPMADALAAAGLKVAIAGPNGNLLTVGDGVDSRLGRWAAGSSRVAIRPGGVLGVRGTVAALAAAGLTALVVAAVGRERTLHRTVAKRDGSSLRSSLRR